MGSQDLAELKGKYLDQTAVKHELIKLPEVREGHNSVVNFFKSEEGNPNSKFVLACKVMGIPPTRRQASKWLNKKGVAFTQGRFKEVKE
jgi:hypothetical protein